MFVIGGSREAGRFALHDFRVGLAREAARAPGPASPSRGALRYRTAAPPGEIRAATERLLGERSGHRPRGCWKTSSQLHVCPVCYMVQIILNEELGVRSSVNSLQSESRV